MMDEEEGFSK